MAGSAIRRDLSWLDLSGMGPDPGEERARSFVSGWRTRTGRDFTENEVSFLQGITQAGPEDIRQRRDLIQYMAETEPDPKIRQTLLDAIRWADQKADPGSAGFWRNFRDELARSEGWSAPLKRAASIGTTIPLMIEEGSAKPLAEAAGMGASQAMVPVSGTALEKPVVGALAATAQAPMAAIAAREGEGAAAAWEAAKASVQGKRLGSQAMKRLLDEDPEFRSKVRGVKDFIFSGPVAAHTGLDEAALKFISETDDPEEGLLNLAFDVQNYVPGAALAKGAKAGSKALRLAELVEKGGPKLMEALDAVRKFAQSRIEIRAPQGAVRGGAQRGSMMFPEIRFKYGPEMPEAGGGGIARPGESSAKPKGIPMGVSKEELAAGEAAIAARRAEGKPPILMEVPEAKKKSLPEPVPQEDVRRQAKMRALEGELERAGEPGWTGQMNPADIEADPQRFQYKAGTDEAGAGELLKDVRKYDPELGGQILVWKDPTNGKTYVINGHHRLELAKRTGAGAVTVRYIEAADAQTARMKGALANIAEGRGTSIDAAKVFRDAGLSAEDLKERGISLREGMANEGLALTKLDDSIFHDVAVGRLEPKRGVAIAKATENHAEQRAVYDFVKKKEEAGQHVTNATIVELATFVREAGLETRTTKDLFGAGSIEESLAPQKAELAAWVKQQLSGEKNTFGFISKDARAKLIGEKGAGKVEAVKAGEISAEAAKILEAFDRLKASKGPVSAALTEAARRMKQGVPIDVVRTELRAQIRDAVDEALKAPEGLPPGGLEGPRGEGSGAGGAPVQEPAPAAPGLFGEPERPAGAPPEVEPTPAAAGGGAKPPTKAPPTTSPEPGPEPKKGAPDKLELEPLESYSLEDETVDTLVARARTGRPGGEPRGPVLRPEEVEAARLRGVEPEDAPIGVEGEEILEPGRSKRADAAFRAELRARSDMPKLTEAEKNELRMRERKVPGEYGPEDLRVAGEEPLLGEVRERRRADVEVGIAAARKARTVPDLQRAELYAKDKTSLASRLGLAADDAEKLAPILEDVRRQHEALDRVQAELTSGKPSAERYDELLSIKDNLNRNLKEAWEVAWPKLAPGFKDIGKWRPIAALEDLWRATGGALSWEGLVEAKIMGHVPGAKKVQRLFTGTAGDESAALKVALERKRAGEKIARDTAQKVGRMLSEGFDEAEREMIGGLLRGWIEPRDIIRNEKNDRLLLAFANAREVIDEYGRMAVDLGLLDNEKFYENVGVYLPQLYREGHLARFAEAQMKRIRQGGLAGAFSMDLSRMKKRRIEWSKLNLTAEGRERMKQMGAITEGALPAARAVLDVGTDVARGRFLKEVSIDPLMASQVPEPGFVQVPKDKRYGAVAGMYLHPDAWHHVRSLVDDRTLPGRIYDKIMGAYRYGKTRLNPAYHARNAIYNTVKFDLVTGGGAMDPRQLPWFVRKVKEYAKGEGNYQKYADADLFRSHHPDMLKDARRELDEAFGQFDKLEGPSFLSKLASLPGDLGRAGDDIFRYFYAEYAQEKMGMSAPDAIAFARRMGGDWSKVGPLARWIDRFPLPFMGWTIKEMPILAEALVKHPVTAAKYAALMGAVSWYAAKKMGWTDEDIAKEEAIQEKGWFKNRHMTRLPWKDKDGRTQYFDWTFIAPSFPELGSFSEAVTAHPLTALVQLANNKDAFTDRAIFNPGDWETGRGWVKTADYLTKKWLPTFTPGAGPGSDFRGGYAWSKLADAIAEQPDYLGRVRSKAKVLADVFAGLKIQPIDYQEQARFINEDIQRKIQGLSRQAQDLEDSPRYAQLSAEERQAKIEAIARAIAELERQVIEEKDIPDFRPEPPKETPKATRRDLPELTPKRRKRDLSGMGVR